MKYIVVLLLISLTFSTTLFHPNSLKQTIDYSSQGRNWQGNCKSGPRQSPIDVEKYDKIPKSVLKLNYGKNNGKVKFNGSSYYIDVTKNTDMILYTDPEKNKWNIEYYLKRIIFKVPAEHLIEGIKYDMEAQLVHETSSKTPNNILIISFFGKATINQKDVHDFWKEVDFYGTKSSDLSQLKSVLESSGEYFVYEGSQTIPNCVENVVWALFKKPIYTGYHERNAAERLFCKSCMPKGNVREVQPVGDRKIYSYKLP